MTTYILQSVAVTTYYISIGNSDDKLSQAEWARYIHELVDEIVPQFSTRCYGVWFCLPDSKYQNMCVAIEIPDTNLVPLRLRLSALCQSFRQDEIALARAEVEFVTAMSP